MHIVPENLYTSFVHEIMMQVHASSWSIELCLVWFGASKVLQEKNLRNKAL